MKLNISDFEIASLEDELRVDELCRDLLLDFYNERVGSGLSEHDATQLANSADFFVRDYLIGARQANLLDTAGGAVRKFAGNWYIVNTLEPDSAELEKHLAGACEFFRYLAGKRLISADALREIEDECRDIGYYRQRIESFLAIEGDGYYEWEAECSLKK